MTTQPVFQTPLQASQKEEKKEERLPRLEPNEAQAQSHGGTLLWVACPSQRVLRASNVLRRKESRLWRQVCGGASGRQGKCVGWFCEPASTCPARLRTRQSHTRYMIYSTICTCIYQIFCQAVIYVKKSAMKIFSFGSVPSPFSVRGRPYQLTRMPYSSSSSVLLCHKKYGSALPPFR